MNQTIQIIHQAYKNHQYRFSTKPLLLASLGFALLNIFGNYFLGIPSIPLKPSNLTGFLFDLVYNMIMFVLLQNLTLFTYIIFYQERKPVFGSIHSSLNHSKKRMIGYYEIEEKLEEIQDQLISIGAYVTSLGKITDAEQLAPVLYHIDEELKKIPKLQSKIEELNKLKPQVKTLEENQKPRPNELDYNRIIADLRKTIFDLKYEKAQSEKKLEKNENSVPLEEFERLSARLLKVEEELRKLKGE